MPLRHQPPTLRRATMIVIAKNFEELCYSCTSAERMTEMIDTEEYLNFEGPFIHMPPSLLEDMMDAILEVKSLHRKHFHMLVHQQLENASLNFGVGDVFHGFHFIKERCKNLKRLDVSYLKHIKPNVLLGLVPCFASLVSLNLRMTLTIDQMLGLIGEQCTGLKELNLASTSITDRGLIMLCLDQNGQKRCQKLIRLIVTDTWITAAGATVVLQSLPNLHEFDYDNIYEAFSYIENWNKGLEMRLLCEAGIKVGADLCINPPDFLHLCTLISSVDRIEPEDIDTALRLCPEARSIVIANAWISSEVLYKYMVLEHLTSLSITNSDGLTLDFHDGVLPLLITSGSRLNNLILAKFTAIDLTAIGKACPRIINLALSSIAHYEPISQISSELFNQLEALEIWADPATEMGPNILRQLLLFSPKMKNVLFKGCEAISDKLLDNIWKVNPMKMLSHVTLDHCHVISAQSLHALLDGDNELTVLRIWSCLNIAKTQKIQLATRIEEENMDLYFEWFQYDE